MLDDGGMDLGLEGGVETLAAELLCGEFWWQWKEEEEEEEAEEVEREMETKKIC